MATALDEKWAQPHEVDDVTLAFPANVASMMPSREECDEALRHLGAIQGSFEPKHEHKEVAVAYLASLWFVKPSYGRGGSNG